MDHTRIAPTIKTPRGRNRVLLVVRLATVVAGAILLCSAIGTGAAIAANCFAAVGMGSDTCGSP